MRPVFASIGALALILCLAWLADVAASPALRAEVDDIRWWISELPALWRGRRNADRHRLRFFIAWARIFWRLRNRSR